MSSIAKIASSVRVTMKHLVTEGLVTYQVLCGRRGVNSSTNGNIPRGKPWDRQPVSGKLRRKLGVSPGFAAHQGSADEVQRLAGLFVHRRPVSGRSEGGGGVRERVVPGRERSQFGGIGRGGPGRFLRVGAICGDLSWGSHDYDLARLREKGKKKKCSGNGAWDHYLCLPIQLPKTRSATDLRAPKWARPPAGLLAPCTMLTDCAGSGSRGTRADQGVCATNSVAGRGLY